MRNWTAQEIERLTRWVGRYSHEQIARRLGRSTGSVKTAAQRFGLVCRHRVTEADRDYIRKHYGRLPTIDIAKHVGRSVTSIYAIASNMGLTKSQRFRMPAFRQFFLDRHAQGYSDPEIAAEWGVDRHAVSALRKHLGLSSNQFNARHRAKIRRAMEEQCRREGVATLAELRRKVFSEYASGHGWPADLRPRAVQILNALWDRGPMTRRELADAIGMPWKGARASLMSNDPEGSYLAHLQARGLVVNLGRIRRGTGSGHSVCVYSLPLTIEREESKHAG